jgi:haloacid dehalogenase superfamily, subfamily IA, variant 3 with third motif having DD or ED
MLSDLSFAVRAIIFDSDGVLVDSDASVIRAWSRWALARDLDPAGVLAFVHGRPARDTVAAFSPSGDVAAALADIDGLELGEAHTVQALPGAVALAEHLPAGRWAIVTSANRALAHARLSAAAIPEPPVLITASDVARGKPHPDGYAMALRSLGVEPRDAVVIEDTPSGAAAAHAAGVPRVIGVSRRAMDAGAIAVVRDLRALSWNGVLHVAARGRIA